MRNITASILFLFAFLFSTIELTFAQKINRYKNNKYEGLWISYSDSVNKKIESKGKYRDGREIGVWKFYYEDGTLRKRERYAKKNIKTKYFYPNGKIKSKGNSMVVMEGEYLHFYYQGKWIYFSEDGKPTELIEYEKGTQIRSTKIKK
jgi:antitoxin component YwqK of YwqJK toxin-antitoxin module